MRKILILTILIIVIVPIIGYANVIIKNSGSNKVIYTTIPSITNGLVGWWTFDGENITNGRINDISGNGNHGSAISIATSTFYAAGKIGQAGNFDGVNNSVVVGAGLDQNGEVSICAWINTSTLSTTRAIVNNGSTGSAFDYYLDVNRTSAKISLGWSNTGAVKAGNTSLNINRWYHACGVRSGSSGNWTATLYLDGVNDGSGTTATNPAGINAESRIGSFASSGFFQGFIDDVRIYNRALSATEILQLYNSSSVTYYTPPSITDGLVGWWTFDGKNMLNGVAKDSSGNNRNGNLIGIATSTFYAAGKIGQGGGFDGVNDYVILTGSSTILPSSVTGATISLWFRRSSNSDQRIVSFADGSNTNFALLQGRTSNKASAFFRDASDVLIQVDSSSSITSGIWYHLVATASAGSGLLYINGVQVGSSGSVDISQTLQDMTAAAATIGAAPNGSTIFNGLLDDVRIYNRALSAREIKQLYNMGI